MRFFIALIFLWFALPAAAEPAFVPNLDILARQGNVERLANGGVLFTPPSPKPVADVGNKDVFLQAIVLYVPRGEDQDGPSGLVRTLTVHYNEANRENARRTVRLLARLVGLHRSRLHHSPVFGRNRDEAHIYLTPNRSLTMESSGGETRDNNLYIYSTATPRTNLEWTRTVVHEWGHLTLLAARGYLAPENDAAGYLGERLYMKWLRETQAVESSDDGVTRADLHLYEKRQIVPLIAQYLKLKDGPRDAALYTMDARAMDLYIGAILNADAAWGSGITATVLYALPDATPRAFFAALRETLLRIPVPPRTACWTPLKSGWRRVAPAAAAAAR